jgi:hypothetical protein
MGALTLQIMILVASFLFYRILRSGFDSWKAILIDFGIVLFLFGLQYYLQKKQEKSDDNEEIMFPAGPISSFFGANFPSKIASIQPKESKKNHICTREDYGCYLKLNTDTFMDPMERKILTFQDEIGKQKIWKNNQYHIKDEGFYIIQLSCDTDIVPYHAKLTIRGSKNHLHKPIHDGENSFIIHLKGEDKISFEIENANSNVMIHDTTTLYVIRL